MSLIFIVQIWIMGNYYHAHAYAITQVAWCENLFLKLLYILYLTTYILYEFWSTIATLKFSCIDCVSDRPDFDFPKTLTLEWKCNENGMKRLVYLHTFLRVLATFHHYYLSLSTLYIILNYYLHCTFIFTGLLIRHLVANFWKSDLATMADATTVHIGGHNTLCVMSA